MFLVGGRKTFFWKMYAVERLSSYITRSVYTVSGPFHPFGGAVDIIVIEQPDGSFKSSPWYIRFGKFQGVLKTKEKVVNICVNGSDAGFHMYLNHKGEAYFLKDSDDGNVESSNSPPTSGDESDHSVCKDQVMKAESCNYDDDRWNATGNSSKGPRVLGLMFGRRSMREDKTGANVERVSSLERAEFAADLLEMKWSTNLPMKDRRFVDKSVKAISKNQEVEKEGSSTPDDVFHEGADKSGTTVSDTEFVEETRFHSSQCVKTDEFSCTSQTKPEIDEVTAPAQLKLNQEPSNNHLEEALPMSPSPGANEKEESKCDILKTKQSVASKKNVLETAPHIIHSYMGSTSQETQQARKERYDIPGHDVLPSLTYCETLKRTTVMFDFSSKRSNETAECEVGERLEPYTEAVVETIKLTSEVTPPSVSTQSDIIPPSKSTQYVQEDKCGDLSHLKMEISGGICSLRPEDHEAGNINEFSANEEEVISHVYPQKMHAIGETCVKKLGVSEDECNESGGSNKVDNPTLIFSRNTEDDQILFGEIDGVTCEDIDMERRQLDISEGDADELELKDELESHGCLSLMSTIQTCPISIPRSRDDLDESELFVRSLPNFRSHINDLEVSEQHNVSQSLNSDTKHYENEIAKNETSSSSESEGALDASTKTVNSTGREQEKDIAFHQAVELSLCKHLVYEGIGTDATCQAFSSEKEHIFEPQEVIAADQDNTKIQGNNRRAIVPTGGNWRLWPFGVRKAKMITNVRPAAVGVERKNGDSQLRRESFMLNSNKKKMLTPTSEQLSSLNLKEGQNMVTFTFSTAMLGKQQVDARIYLWKWNTRIVISDVDGTITRSDVLGQFMPLVGIDWSQSGVTNLFSAIKDNGYQLLFLSARAISQAYLTRQFLFNLKQDGKALPDGPVVISPDGLFPSLYREVIRRVPHEFKISCLEDIKALFPPDCNPFYAGFGNRDTDEISYLKVGIPKGKIFIINPKGEVAVNRRVDSKSYTSLHALVNDMFPSVTSAEQEDFNSWNYWKLPVPDVDM